MQEFHWRRKNQSEWDAVEKSKRNNGEAKRKISLRDAVITVSQTAKAMGNLMKGAEMERAKVIGKKNVEAIANLQRQARIEHAALKVSNSCRSAKGRKPQQENMLFDAYRLL